MKLLKISKTLRTIFYLILGINSTGLFGADFSAKTILDSMTIVMQPNSSQGKMEQEIITSSNIKRVFTFNYYSEDKGKNVLIRYMEPRKVRNNAFLIKNSGEDIWVYFPRTRRVRKLASHAKKQKAQGSDFSYEDFSGSEEWKTDYRVKQKPSGERNNYLLNFTPRIGAGTSYDSLKIYVNKLNYYPDRMLYYQNGVHLKTLNFQDVKKIQGIPTAMRMLMENHLEDSKTTIRILEMEYNVIFDREFFTERNLKK
ncbi:MAG: outer membrane lipoprotein-sorting protein [Candidatus Marinimicrobia bacterium]|nr:outer membrane lipoprotein-sorting protein [Candidatus Neomarinimicrobiota bacterium]